MEQQTQIILQDIADAICEIVADCYNAQDVDFTIEEVQQFINNHTLTTQQKRIVFSKYWQRAQDDELATLKEIKNIADMLEVEIVMTFMDKQHS